MKNFKMLASFLLATTLMFALSTAGSFAQTTLSGKQIRGNGNNAQLECAAITLSQAAKITQVTGDNAGFWIVKSAVTIHRFWKPNDPSAVNTILQPGTYYVYPNLKENQQTATVSLTLQ